MIKWASLQETETDSYDNKIISKGSKTMDQVLLMLSPCSWIQMCPPSFRYEIKNKKQIDRRVMK